MSGNTDDYGSKGRSGLIWSASGGPWGQPPKGGNGGGSGGQPPDLEDLLKRGGDKIRQVFPGGGNRGNGRGNGRGQPPQQIGPSPWILPVAGAAVVAFWLFQCIYVVQPDEVGVVMRFGKAQQELSQPGLHFALWPVDQVETAAILKENQDDIGIARGDVQQARNTGIMLSGDQNLVDVDFSVIWKVSDPYKFLFKVAENRDVVRMVAEAAMREYVGRTPADEFRTRGRNQAQIAVQQLIQQTLDNYDAGVTVIAVNLQRADPPSEVIDAFEEVQRAQQDQDKFKQDATAYANKTLGDARGQAAQIRQAASGYKDSVIDRATGEAQRFESVLAEYQKAPEVTRQRLYIDAMADVLSTTNKVVVDPKAGANGVTPYLPLNQLQNRQ